MNLSEFKASLNDTESATYDKLVTEAPTANPKATRSKLAGLLAQTSKRQQVKLHFGLLIEEFFKNHGPKESSNDSLTINEFAASFFFPMSAQLRKVLSMKAKIAEGEPAPQFPYEICALHSMLLRFEAIVLIAGYQKVQSGKDVAINKEIHAGLQNPADGTWLNLVRTLVKKPIESETIKLTASLQAALNAKGVLPQKHLAKKNALSASADLIHFRNRLIHGERLQETDIEQAYDNMELCTMAISFLKDYQLAAKTATQTYLLMGELPQEADIELPGEPKANDLLLVAKDAKENCLNLSPLIYFQEIDDKLQVTMSDVLFLNAGSTNKLKYIGFNSNVHLEGQTLATYDQFKDFMASLPAPELPPNARLNFDDLAAYHTNLFVGRDDVFEEVEKFTSSTHQYGEIKALAGMGKTAVMANLYAKHATKEFEQVTSGDRWAFHFCANAGGRDSALVAYRSIIAQCCDMAGKDRSIWLSDDLEDIRNAKLPGIIATLGNQLAEGENLIIAIDALDEGFTSGEDSIASMILPFVPKGGKFLFSYRVSPENENEKVSNDLQHVDKEEIYTFETANPLKGLTQENVTEFLQKTTEQEEFNPKVLEKIWIASDAEKLNGADPFYLRLLADALDAGQANINRIETIPKSLDNAFEDTWLKLPKDHDYLLHKVLCNLAIMHDYGDDELFAELINKKSDDNAPDVTPTDVAILRTKAGKLLQYDGDNYRLFHDRFKMFLVG